MKPTDYIYNQAFRQFISMGYSDRDSGEVGADAVRRWKTKSKATEAVEEAIKHGKKIYIQRRTP